MLKGGKCSVGSYCVIAQSLLHSLSWLKLQFKRLGLKRRIADPDNATLHHLIKVLKIKS